jgi:hypothetical protein
MSTTPKEIIDRARRLIEDIGPSYKVRQAEMYGFVDEAQREIAKLRPDAVIQGSEVVPIATLTAVTGDAAPSALEISDSFREPLVDYVCYRAMLKRASYADASRAQIHIARFKEFLLN